MSVTGSLDQIRTKIRRITARPSPNQISNNEIDEYVNSFYEYDLPEHLRLLNLKQDYNITLEPGVGTYPFEYNDYITIQGPLYIAGYESQLYQDKQTFYQFYPQLQKEQHLATGDGTAGPYSASITAIPLIAGSIFISTVDSAGDSLTCKDDGSGDLIDPSGTTIGNVDYVTGLVSNLLWSNTIDASEVIYSQSSQYAAARPRSALLYDNEITVRPIPDKAYEFTITAFVKPTALLSDSDEPILREWWELLALGASMKIFEDNLDMESYQKVNMLFDKQLRLAERRTLKQLSTQRAATIYGNYDYYPYSGQYPYL